MSSAFPDPIDADFSALAFVNAYRKGEWERTTLVVPPGSAFVPTVAGDDVQNHTLWGGIQSNLEGIATSFVRVGLAGRGWVGERFWYLHGNGGGVDPNDDVIPISGRSPFYADFAELLTEAGWPSNGWVRERPREIASLAAVVDTMGNATVNGQVAWMVSDPTGQLYKRVSGAWTVAPANAVPDRLSSMRGEVPFGSMQDGDYISPTVFKQMRDVMVRMYINVGVQLDNAHLGKRGGDTEFDRQDAIDGATADYAGSSLGSISDPQAYTLSDTSPSGSAPPDDVIYDATIERQYRQHRVDGIANHMTVTKTVVFTASTRPHFGHGSTNNGREQFDTQGNNVVEAAYFKIDVKALVAAGTTAVCPTNYGAGGPPANFLFADLGSEDPDKAGWFNAYDGDAMITWNLEYGGNGGGLAGLGLLLGMM